MEKKLIKVLFLSLFLFGCATKKPAPIVAEKPPFQPVYNDKNPKPTEAISGEPRPSDIKTDGPQSGQSMTPPAAQVPQAKAPEIKSVPRLGIIFSAGGAKAWGHIGVIKEIERAKWPIKAVAGLEWGALVAASYAHKLSANEVEWELSKVKELDELEQSSDAIFGNESVGDLKTPFVCPSLNIVKQEVFLLSRGQLSKLMPFCIASPSLSPAYKQSIAMLDHISELAQHIRATGVKKVVLVNVLAQSSKRPYVGEELSAENMLWVKAAIEAGRKPAGVDDVIQINLDDYGIKDLDKRRDIIARAAELSYDQIKKLSTKYGL